MTADASVRRTALQDRTADLAGASRPGVAELAESVVPRMLNLRVKPGTAGPVEAALGGALPEPLQVSTVAPGLVVLWLGPDELLIVDLDGIGVPPLSGATSVVDVSANRTLLVLSGPQSESVLEKGIQIDLHGTAPGWHTQTLLASVPIILWRRAEDEWNLLVRPSFANYLADWLLDAMLEFTAS